MDKDSPTPGFPAFLGRGWGFGTTVDEVLGLSLDRRWGRVVMSEGALDVQQSIAIILGTARGERVMRPDFGCGIHELPFETISAPLVAEIRRVVRDALRRFEARIDVLEVEVDTRDHINGKLEISLAYRLRTTNQVGNFVYPFYFGEGG
ncbi:MAG: GPW/gp25 family protein [Paracoccaceae bacterium]|uniref:GPW/gp25 family protein n=1 Tax=Pseudophaeobacter sp. TaxID=1971739 RepID=UPI00329A05C0